MRIVETDGSAAAPTTEDLADFVARGAADIAIGTVAAASGPEPEMGGSPDPDAPSVQAPPPAEPRPTPMPSIGRIVHTTTGEMTPHHTMRTKEALRHGAAEIERLRRENEVLAIKANAFDTFAAFVFLVSPKQYAGSAPDSVWILRQLLAEIEAEEGKAGQGAATGARV